MTNPSKRNPNQRLRKSSQQQVRRQRVGMAGAQKLFGDPDTETFASISARMAATRRHTAALGNGNGADSLMMATGRPRDPMFYWRQNNIPFDFTKPEELRKIREFCNTPDAPITMADGSTKPIGEVQPGDQVMGWRVRLTNSGTLVRQWCTSTVLATNSREAEIVQLNMASGNTIKCTPDHKWANPYFTTTLTYSAAKVQQLMQDLTSEYQVATAGSTLIQVKGTYTLDLPSNDQFNPAPDVAPTASDIVESVTPLGQGTVVSMQTTTGNYIAWGYASKNCRLLYMTHPVVAACVDIYSKLPLQGMHVESKDDELVEFYTNLFFDQLKLEDHLVALGRQYWLAGEIFSLGMWNENLGVWEDEQLISPDDVEVEKSLFISKPRFMMRLPERLRTVLTERQPVEEYQELVSEYPELLQFAKEDQLMPVSNYVMYQLKFESDDFSERGVSILMRAFRAIIQEEMLMTALDSIADRLYTPMIVAKLGASATDLGTDSPWIPTPEQKQEFNESLDAALAADFRVLTTNFATNIETVFGRENVPDLSADFDRLTERILMAFGLSQTMLTGASAGETYAADALNRDVVTQLLTHYQRKLKDYFRARAEIVAEAHEHFDYEVRDGERFLVTEDIWEIDEETGEEILLEQPKLLVPELKFKILNLTDEQQMSEFIESLAMDGQIPIPIRDRIRRTGIDFDEMIEVKTQETVQLAVAEQRARKELYATLVAEGLPIPDDLIKDFRPQAIQANNQMQMPGASDVTPPMLGQGPQTLPLLAPSPDDIENDQNAAQDQMLDDAENSQTDPQLPQEGDDVPPESTEQMGRMPKPASRILRTGDAGYVPTYSIWDSLTLDQRRAYLTPLSPEEMVERPVTLARMAKTAKTKPVKKLGIRKVMRERLRAAEEGDEEGVRAHGSKFDTPRHVNMRRYLNIPDSLKLRDDE